MIKTVRVCQQLSPEIEREAVILGYKIQHF